MTDLAPAHPTLLLSPATTERCAEGIDAIFGIGAWTAVDPTRLPPDGHVDCAYFSQDVHRQPDGSVSDAATRAFFHAVERAPRLQWLQLFSAGAERPVHARLRAAGVAVCTASGASAPFVATTAITGMLMLARGFPRWMEAQRRHAWLPPADPLPRDLRGATALVVGTGPIGREVARLCQALGLRTIGLRRGQGAIAPFDDTRPYAALHEVAGRCEVIVVACPLSDITRGLVDARVWSAARRGVLFVNVGRGEVVDEQAFVAALAAGTVGGAYLDVFAREPLAAESLLWDLPNVIVSPHAAAESATVVQAVDAIFLENLRRWADGRPLLNSAP